MKPYPEAPRNDHRDTYHDSEIPDPFRPLEDPNSPDTRAWIEAQNGLTYGFLETIPQREGLRERLTQLWDFPKSFTPSKKGGRLFEFRNSGLQNQNVLYVLEHPTDKGRVLIDPNTLSEDGTIALVGYSVSSDGKHLAYATASGGSDWMTWRVRDISTLQDLPETVEWSKFSSAEWLPDGQSFLYQRFQQPLEGEAYTSTNEAPQLMLHRLGSDPAEDSVVYERPDKREWMFHPSISDDKQYLLLTISRSTERRNLVFYKKLEDETFTELISEFEAAFDPIGNDGSVFYFKTDFEADRSRIIAIDLEQPEREYWRTVVPEQDAVLLSVKLVGDTFICVYLEHATHKLKRYSTKGEPLGEISLPTLGSLTDLTGEREDTEVYFGFTSFLFPTTPYRYDVKTGALEALSKPKLDFDPSPYETRQVFVSSKDGTKVPLFLIHRRDLETDGQNPALLYGYGGFNVSLTPAFSVGRLAWLELGGVLAIANLRGGGEYGSAWHDAGTVHQKQNVFDDFIACAEWLTSENITSPKKLAIQGGSNGGLLVGACMTQRPELFGAALPAVGVLDMLRYHLFTIGWAWVSDYGSSDDKEQFETLLKYSPLHNLKAGTHYPATLITTGDHDDRVVPAHSFKFAAALQKAQGGDAPTLIRIQTRAGHGMGKPTKLLIEEQADIWAFLVKVLDIKTKVPA